MANPFKPVDQIDEIETYGDQDIDLLLTKLHSKIDDLEHKIARTCKFFVENIMHFDTVAGSATNEYEIQGAKESHCAFVMMKELGASPVTVKTAHCMAGKVVVEYSADPGNDHKVCVVII